MVPASNHVLRSRRAIILLVFLLVVTISYFLFFQTLTFSPVAESDAMQQLERTEETATLQPFVTDGCSGNVSQNWSIAIDEISQYLTVFAESYADVASIPFEQACIEHDRLYHAGDGGYIARLQADNQLRSEIINYGVTNAATIQARTGLQTPEEVIFLYELLAEGVYRGVRLGGAPCTGQPYAWGFGYNSGNCIAIAQ